MIFSKTYDLSLHRGYVSRWGMAHAVRELIQNTLDSDSPFQYEFTSEDGGTHSLYLRSEFSTLSPKTLLLGATTKSSADDKIGSFGEGYKIALLVLTREGYDVEIRNGDVLWRPRFRHSRTFNEETLVIDETSLTNRGSGLTFIVHGLSDDDVDKIRSSCLQMQSGIGEIKSTHYGDILMDRPGKLYVGGLYVCDTSLDYSYNIKPEHIRLERDRQTVDGWDLHCITRDMWFATKEYDFVAQMIERGRPDVQYAEYSYSEGCLL